MHIKSKYERLRFPRDGCGFAAITKSYLKQHIENKREGGRYSCDRCEHSAINPERS